MDEQDYVPAPKRDIDYRGIKHDTYDAYGVKLSGEDYAFPFVSRKGNGNPAQVATLFRTMGEKKFRWSGAVPDAGLFGMNLFPPGSSDQITITEGAFDALAAYEMQGSKYPVVSIKNGAESAAKDCVDNFEYLNSFNKIVVCFDADEAKTSPDGKVRYPGQEAAIQVASIFPIGKVRIVTLAKHKDANDYLRAGDHKSFINEWWKAAVYTPAGLKLGSGMWEEIAKPKNYETVTYPWSGLQYATYGLRLSEFVVITAQTKIGKTTLLKELASHLLKETEEKKRGVGFMMFEETNADTCLGLMSIQANKSLHLPDVRAEVEEKELKEYYDAAVNSDRVVIWDHFGSNSIGEVLAKIRHMAALGCKYIILDHLSIVVSDQSGDERKQLDELATKIKTLCMELSICVIAVIHQNRQNQVRGTAGVEQLANIVIKLDRDITDPSAWRRNVTSVTVTANRFCGRSGPVCCLFYDERTGRMEELTKEQEQEYRDGKDHATAEKFA